MGAIPLHARVRGAGHRRGGPSGSGAASVSDAGDRRGSAAASREGTGNTPWPREAKEGGRTFTVYQPQIEKWDGTRLHARAAVSVESQASPLQHFGVVWFSARADVDKANRLVALADFKVDKFTFPSEPDRAAEYQKVLEGRLPREMGRISLDRIQAALAITEAQRGGGASPQPVKNDPPRVILSTVPALLVLVDGKPALRQIEGLSMSLHRVVNSWALVLVDQKSGKHYLRAVGRWFEASTLDGPWTVAARPPAALDAAMQTVAKGQRVNLLENPGPEVKDAVARGVLPTIYVSTVPAELIQTRGRPDYEPIEGTDLLHVANSSANIVLDPADQRHYVLLSGRWFRSASLAEGPWEFVPHDKLPAAFAKIPEAHPRGAVLASVPGTPQAKEALIDNSIPQTAEVNRATTRYQATYEGAPRFQPIEGTSLHYAVNSPVPVIQVDPKTYYSLKDGVWFAASAPLGPWTVATTVPAAIYTIPASSPLHYVTYVHVYGETPQTVYVGYTPGYYGTVVAPSSVVVYGTGYVYPPAYVGAYWYPPPPTYGYGAGFWMGRRHGLRLRGGHVGRLGRGLGLLLRRRGHRPDRQHQPERCLQPMEPERGAVEPREPGAVTDPRAAPAGPAAGPVARPERHDALQRRLCGPRRQHLPARRRRLGAEHGTGLEPGGPGPGQGNGGRPESPAAGEKRGGGPRDLLPARRERQRGQCRQRRARPSGGGGARAGGGGRGGGGGGRRR